MRPGLDRRARDFAVALEGLASPSLTRDPAMASLVGLAESLRALPLGPTPQFRDSLRTRLVAVASVAAPLELAPATTWDRVRVYVDHWRVQRSIAAAAAGMATVVAIAGVATASQRSLPGDPFYGLKRSTERVQLAFARTPVNEGKRYLQIAETRLDEVSQLVGHPNRALGLPTMQGISGPTDLALGSQDRGERVASTLADMNSATRSGSQLLTKAYENDDSRSAAPLRALADFADRQQRGIMSLLFEIPAEAHSQAETSLALISSVQQRATALLTYGICGESCAPAPTPTPGPSTAPEPQPQPAPSPTSDDLGPVPCRCAVEPSPSPSPEPSKTPEPSQSPSPSPSPSSETHLLPVPVPSPLGQTVQDILEEVEKLLPVPLPTPLGGSAPVPLP